MLSISACLTLAACAFDQARPRTADAAKALFDLGTSNPGAAAASDIKIKLGSPDEIRPLDAGRRMWIYVRTQQARLFSSAPDTATDYIAAYTFAPTGLLVESSYQAVPAANRWIP